MMILSRSQSSKDEELLSYKDQVSKKMMDVMNAARSVIVTPLVGQEMIYGAKEDEAKRFLEISPEPDDLSAFPFLSEEVGITAESALELAQLWSQTGPQWRITAAKLEGLRMKFKSDMVSAQTKTEVDQLASYFEASMKLSFSEPT